MDKQGKIWGETTEFFNLNLVSGHYLTIYKDGHSSTHRHLHKTNLFYVISGKIKIIQEKDGLDDVTVLKEGQVCVVKPGIWHRFKAIETSQVIEIYFTLPLAHDIERKDQGGIDA